MSTFVLDASVALAYLFEEPQGAGFAQAVIERVAEHGAVVPSIWPSEVANAAVVQERRGNLTSDGVENFLSAIRKLQVQVESTIDIFGTTTSLARKWQRSIYDAQYLELSLRRDLPLATLDKTLLKAAQSAGVKCLEHP